MSTNSCRYEEVLILGGGGGTHCRERKMELRTKSKKSDGKGPRSKRWGGVKKISTSQKNPVLKTASSFRAGQ